MIRAPRRRYPPAGAVDVVVIGAGHAGLAMSRCLAELSIDHVVLERGEIANSWRRERWDSLRLLTPNWQSRLPGYAYRGPDPDGYMSVSDVVEFIDGYARLIGASVKPHTTVTSVVAEACGYRVATDRGDWRCRAVVLASGAHGVPAVPAAAAALPKSVTTLTPKTYRNPDQLDGGGVLVVGASASGIQLADEIRRSGRRVILAVGEHIRMPRVYRGLDIQWWLDAVGILDERYDEVDDIVRARRVPSPQLVGTSERATLDLNALTERGIELVGRLVGIDEDGKAQFSGSLRNHCAMADLKLARLLDRLDDWAAQHGDRPAFAPPERFAATRVGDAPRLCVDLARERISTVIFATGFRPDYAWLHVPVFDHKGRLRHDGGVVDAPGLYVLGLNFMRRRKSSFIHGAEDDARDLCAHLAASLRLGSGGRMPRGAVG
ncbi:MAG TPA: NAD(P)-binding domain-containing protein [Gammaproteobacteria bacterium]